MINKCHSGTKLRLLMTLLVITILCLKLAKGSCLSYGHSCWGAHGKRGGPPKPTLLDDATETLLFGPQSDLDQTNALPSVLTAADRWALVSVLPNKNPYYPFSKVIRRPRPLPVAPFFVGDNMDTAARNSRSRVLETSSKHVATRSNDAGNDLKHTLTSAESGNARQVVLSGKSTATSNVHRLDYSHEKDPSTVSRTQYTANEDSYEDNPTVDRFIAPINEDIGQMLLVDEEPPVRVSSSSDTNDVLVPFNRKLFSEKTETVASMNGRVYR